MSEPQNYRMTLAYDGTDFCGYQCQPGRRTVQDTIEQALDKVTQTGIRVAGAGRTDSGVHAVGMVVSFRSDWRHEPDELERALNAVLPGDVAVRDLERVAETFHARYSATSREYIYRVYESPVRLPHLDRYSWRLQGCLDPDRLRTASAMLVGEADFRAFGQAPDGKSTVRSVYRAEWVQAPQVRWNVPEWEFWIEANGFLRGMVRRIVGSLVQVGQGTAEPEGIRGTLAARDPALAGAPAPACGLFFWRARYPGDRDTDCDRLRQLAGAD
ncbi:MAG: tRNA pseudouridine(38-40) synthase TruA [Anaerolineae bacterium]